MILQIVKKLCDKKANSYADNRFRVERKRVVNISTLIQSESFKDIIAKESKIWRIKSKAKSNLSLHPINTILF